MLSTTVRGFLLSLVVLVGGVSAQSAGQDRSGDSALCVPLKNGELRAGDLLVAICDAVELPDDHQVRDAVKGLDWTIDVRSALGRGQLRELADATGGALTIEIEDDQLTLTVDREAAESIRRGVDRSVKAWVATAKAASPPPRYGIAFVDRERRRTPLEKVKRTTPHVVLLVHGLDEPGGIWDDLIPPLVDAGHRVTRFDYPNDGPISDAADLLAVELAALRTAGVKSVDIVAHSMGGLVGRDLLTRKAYYNGDGRGGDRFPAVHRLIMLGTPNHGSEMARFRGLSEIYDQLLRMSDNGTVFVDPAADGSGEAGTDLLPGSQFLERLNGRAMPRHVQFTIVAGKWLRVSGDRVDEWVDEAVEQARSSNAPAWLRKLVENGGHDLAGAIKGTVNGVGDGVVALDSARLEGVDDAVIVEANHLSMIINPLPGNVTPPAIPIVLERLGEEATERLSD